MLHLQISNFCEIFDVHRSTLLIASIADGWIWRDLAYFAAQHILPCLNLNSQLVLKPLSSAWSAQSNLELNTDKSEKKIVKSQDG